MTWILILELCAGHASYSCHFVTIPHSYTSEKECLSIGERAKASFAKEYYSHTCISVTP